MSKLSERNLKFETKQLHIGQETADPVTDARAVPIYATTSYVFHNSQHAADRFALKDAGNIYGRLTNPTEDVFEKRIAALEGGTAALAVASGAAAVSYALQALAKAGDNIVAAKTIYGGTYNWLEHTFSEYGVTTKFVDPDEENAFENGGLNASKVRDKYNGLVRYILSDHHYKTLNLPLGLIMGTYVESFENFEVNNSQDASFSQMCRIVFNVRISYVN